jgi:energy-coupling factor transporter transmembrane protein EcfT
MDSHTFLENPMYVILIAIFIVVIPCFYFYIKNILSSTKAFVFVFLSIIFWFGTTIALSVILPSEEIIISETPLVAINTKNKPNEAFYLSSGDSYIFKIKEKDKITVKEIRKDKIYVVIFEEKNVQPSLTIHRTMVLSKYENWTITLYTPVEPKYVFRIPPGTHKKRT